MKTFNQTPSPRNFKNTDEFPDVDSMNIEEFERFLSREAKNRKHRRSNEKPREPSTAIKKSKISVPDTLDAKLDLAKR